MPTLDLSAYEPVTNTTTDASAITAAFQTIMAVVNALDDSNVAANAAIQLAKLAAGGATDGQAMVYSAAAGRWQPGNISTILAHDATLVDIASSTTETDLVGTAGVGISIPGGILGTSKTIRVQMIADLMNNTAANHGVTFKLYYGGSSVTSDLLALNRTGADLTRWLVTGNLNLTAETATNAQAVSGVFRISGPVTNGNPVEVCLPALNTTKGWKDLAVDSTGAQNLRLTATLDTSSAQFEFRKRYVIVEVI